jgi:hypothetical protein
VVNFFIGAILITTGIAAGYVTGKIAQEELKKGFFFLDLLQDIIISLLVFLTAHALDYHWTILGLGAIIIITVFLIKEIRYNYVVYAVLPIMWLIGYLSEQRLAFITLLLLYGLPTGTLLWYTKKTKAVIITPVIFLSMTLILQFIFL